MEAINKKIGCTPFERKSLEVAIKNGFATVQNKSQLVPLTVVVGGRDLNNGVYFNPGDTVWLRGEMIKAGWALEEYTVNGRKFILVPIEQVVMLDNVQPQALCMAPEGPGPELKKTSAGE